MCCDIDDLVTEYQLDRLVNGSPPKEMYWSTPMRRLIKNIHFYEETTVRSLSQIYSVVALQPEEVRKLKVSLLKT
jgi:hypothetical protein